MMVGAEAGFPFVALMALTSWRAAGRRPALLASCLERVAEGDTNQQQTG